MKHHTRRLFWYILLQAQTRYELSDNATATGHAKAAMLNTAEQTAKIAWLLLELFTTSAEDETVYSIPTGQELRDWVADAINHVIASKHQPPAINVQSR